MLEVEHDANEQPGYSGQGLPAQTYSDRYRDPYRGQEPAVSARPSSRLGPKANMPPENTPQSEGGYQQMNMDNFEPMFDPDPFGLSASMHFPTSYNFDQPPPPQPPAQR